MADEEQVELLKRSVSKWNKWRRDHPEIRPDLRSVDLFNADLHSVDLHHADLSFANLSGYLSFAIPSNTYFVNTSLSSADLSSTKLSYTNLSGVDLSGTNLTSADLIGANLTSADLIGANLTSARLYGTVFAQNDLSTVKGLAEINHHGPSHIALNTVKLPQDGSALHFLRGAGIPDELISWYQGSMMHPIQYHSVFISYSSQDEILARRLHADLQDQGVRCWFAPHDLVPGQLMRKGIDDAIHAQDKLLLILSEHSVESGWVGYEVETALSREIRQHREILFPIRIDDAVFHCTANWATSLRDQRHIGDFTQWAEPLRYQQVLERLLHDLKANDATPRKSE